MFTLILKEADFCLLIQRQFEESKVLLLSTMSFQLQGHGVFVVNVLHGKII